MIGDFDSDIPALRELVRDLAALDLSEGPAALIAKLIQWRLQDGLCENDDCKMHQVRQ